MWGCLEQRPRSRHLPAGLHHTQEPSQPHVPWGEATRPRTWGKRVPEGRVTALQSALPAGRGARGLVRHIDPALPDARCLGTSSPAHGLSPTASGLRCRFCTNRTRRPLGLFQAAGRTAGRGRPPWGSLREGLLLRPRGGCQAGGTPGPPAHGLSPTVPGNPAPRTLMLTVTHNC